MITLSVFIPAYNEAGNLENVVKDTLSVLPGIVRDYEIIIVDDGSKDETGEIAERLARENNKIRAIHHHRNLGFGSVQKTGYTESRLEYVMLIPADGQFDPREIRNLIESRDGADIVVGFRKNRNCSIERKIVSACLKFSLRIFFGLYLKDSQWVKMVKRDLFRTINIESAGPFVDAEILIKAKRKKCIISEVETHQLPRISGRSHASSFRLAFSSFIELLSFRLK